MKYSGGLLLRALNRVLGHLTQEQLDNVTHESLLKETIMYLDGLRDKLAAKWKVRRVTEQRFMTKSTLMRLPAYTERRSHA